MVDFVHKKCVPCEGGTPPLDEAKINNYLPLVPGWLVVAGRQLERSFVLKDFTSLMRFVNEVAGVAEQEGHHPDLHVTNWNNLKIVLSTHSIGGLSDNDFILAAKIDQLWGSQLPGRA